MQRKKKKREGYPFAIYLKSEKKVIGGISLDKVDKFQGKAGVGYWLNEKYWNKGYGSEALKAILDFAFKKLKLRRIEINGKMPITHLASDEEYWKKLKEKLQEEVNEFLKENSLGELADILEVVYAIRDLKFKEEDLEITRKKKQEEIGAFKEKIILDEVKDNPKV